MQAPPRFCGAFFCFYRKNATQLHFIFATQPRLWYGSSRVTLLRLKDPGLSSFFFSPSQGTGEPRSGNADGGRHDDHRVACTDR
jgi:hypothetical protein